MSLKVCFPTILASLVFFCIFNLRPKIQTWYIKRVVNLHSMLSDLTLTFITCGEKNEKNRISLQTRSRMAAVSCFRVMILRWKKSCFVKYGYVRPFWEPWPILVRIPWYWLSTSITKYFISRDWPKPETAQEKSVASTATACVAGRRKLLHQILPCLAHSSLFWWEFAYTSVSRLKKRDHCFSI